jgi:hypothetical protein
MQMLICCESWNLLLSQSKTWVDLSRLELEKEILTTIYFCAVHYNAKEENYSFYWL